MAWAPILGILTLLTLPAQALRTIWSCWLRLPAQALSTVWICKNYFVGLGSSVVCAPFFGAHIHFRCRKLSSDNLDGFADDLDWLRTGGSFFHFIGLEQICKSIMECRNILACRGSVTVIATHFLHWQCIFCF